MGIIGSIEGAIGSAAGGIGKAVGEAGQLVGILSHLQGSTTIDGKRVALTPEAIRKATAERGEG